MGEMLNMLNVNSVIKYSTALVIILSVRLLCPIISQIIIFIFHKLFKIETKSVDSGFYGPLKFMFTVIGFGLAIYYLKLPEGIINLYDKVFKILLVLSIARALANCLTPDSTFFSKLEASTRFNGNEQLNAFIAKILKAIIYIVAAFVVMSDLGYNLGGLAAGLGIGSAALALAAQDFVKSIIGGVAIISDKTFEIGDYIQVGLFSGTVIDITFRSTKIRDTQNTIISMPNSVIVTEYVQNWSKMKSRRLEMRLRLGLDTSTETINRCISKIKTMLKANDNIDTESIIVALEEIKEDSNVLLIVAYLKTGEYVEFVDMREKINCSILDVLERENIELVYPTQRVYMKSI